VVKNENAVGYIGLGYLNDSVKALKVEGISGNKENALNGTFPVSRYLYMFTKGWPSGDILNFINFVLSDEGQKLVGEAGFVPIR
jgi:phosphate transport system substrate-binding protein